MLNAATVTQASPFGNGQLIPRGTLREVRRKATVLKCYYTAID